MNCHNTGIRAFLADETAATSIEYALIAILVSVGIIAAVNAFASALNNLWSYTASAVVTNI